MLRIKSTDKIERLVGYLQSEISKRHLNCTLIKVFLYVMWDSRNYHDIIYRPKWTYAVSNFNEYLYFYKSFNLLHWSGNQTKFVPDEDLYSATEVLIEVEDKKTSAIIIEIGKDIPEFQNYYS